MKMMKRLIAALSCLVAVALASGPAAARDIGEIIASGKLRVAIAEEEFMPWLMRGAAGEPIGFEVDIARQLAEGLEVKAEFVERPFSDLIGSLTAGEVDLIVSALSITPERARRVMFSDPYGQSDLELVVSLPDLPEGAEEQSYDMEGMQIAVVAGTTIEIEGRSRFPESEIVAYADLAEARDAFLAGEVNAIIASKPYPEYLVSRDPQTYARIGESLTSTVEAVAVAPDDHRLMNYVNSWIASAIASGFLEDATVYWFETLDWVEQVPGLAEQIEQDNAGAGEQTEPTDEETADEPQEEADDEDD